MRSDATRRMLESIPQYVDEYGQFDIADVPRVGQLVSGSYVKRVNGSTYALTRYGRNYLARHQLIEPTKRSRLIKKDGYSVFEMKVPNWGL